MRRCIVAAALLIASAAQGQVQGAPNLDVQEHLGEPIPLDLSVLDSNGARHTLRESFRGRPVVLTLVYYRCPMLCNLVLGGLARSMAASKLKLGTDYDAVTISFDHREQPSDAALRRMRHLQSLNEPDDAGWPFFVAEEDSVKALADAVGFRYRYDAKTDQYAHAAVSFVVTPEGRISRYLYGLDISPRDLRWSVIEASGGHVGPSLDRVLLTCFRYDPATRTYAFTPKGFLRVGGLAVFGAVAAMLGVLWRRELKKERP
jgi:protein SCO1